MRRSFVVLGAPGRSGCDADDGLLGVPTNSAGTTDGVARGPIVLREEVWSMSSDGTRRSTTTAQTRNIHGLLRAAFRWAVGEELIERDPTDLVKPPVYRQPQARYLDLEDVQRLRGLVTGHALEGSVVLGLAGLRAAEACYVRWGDFADNVLHVKASSLGATKTGRTRSLTLPAGEVAALRAFEAWGRPSGCSGWARGSTTRTPILTDGFGDALNRPT